MKNISDIQKEHLDVKRLYPILTKGVILQRYPTHKHYVIDDFRRNLINEDAFNLLCLSNGSFSIYQIMKKIGSEGDADDEEQQRNVLLFYEDAEKNNLISLNKIKIKNSQTITPVGSYNIYYPYHLSIELTYKCNLKCVHCYIDAGTNKESIFIDTKQLLKTLETLHNNGLRVVELTGGEPLLHPDFFDIFDYCIKNFPHCFLLTNAVLITENNIEKFGKYKERLRMNISLDGSTPDIHDRIRGMKAAFNRTTKAIQLLANMGVNIRVSMTVLPDNQNDIENTLLLAKKLGATSFLFSLRFPFGRAQTHNLEFSKEKSFTYGIEQKKIIDKYKEFVKWIDDETLKKMVSGSKNCEAGYNRYVVSPTGQIRPCLLSSENWFLFGNIFHTPPEIVFRSSSQNSFLEEMKAPNKDQKPCCDCENRFSCSYCWVRGININLIKNINCPWFQSSGIKNMLENNIRKK